MNLRIFFIIIFYLLFLQIFIYASDKNIFGTSKKNPLYLTGYIYALPEGTSKLPKDFSKYKLIGKIYANKLDVKPRSFDKGFPGVTNRFEWFAIDYKGKIYIDKDGDYTFSLLSDDGTKLIIDDKLVIDNDGIHPPSEKVGSIYLKKGYHNIEIPYFQGPRWKVALVFSVIKNGKKILFDINDFSPVKLYENKKFAKLYLNSAILFDFDKYNLKKEAKAVLDKVVQVLNSYKYKKIIVAGYTDDIGSFSYNLKLSEKRAKSVAIYLIKKGIPSGKILIKGYGEQFPRYPNTSDENRAKNRRVEIKIIKE